MSDVNAIEDDKPIQIGDGNSTRERKSRKDKTKSLSTKVVIRRLPPSMVEETFLKQIDPVPEYDYFYFVPADYSLGQNASSRAYINFLHDEGLPKSKSRKKDSKCNTIESDPHYIQFMASLTAESGEVKKSEVKMEYSYQIKDEKKVTSTPLLEYIANKKLERRDERKKKIDERKRQRDDERNRKRSQVAKTIPSSIREQDEDGIIVRVIKSRPRDRGDRGDRFKKERGSEPSTQQSASDTKPNKPEASRDDKRKSERKQRENKRKEERQRFKEERDQKRQAERKRYRKEREMNNKDDTKAEKNSVKIEHDASNKGKEDRVKRYSESRRVRHENKEQNDSKKPVESSEKSTKIAQRETNEKGPEQAVFDKGAEVKDIVKESSEEPSITKEIKEESPPLKEDSKNNDDSSSDNAKDSSSKSLTKEERLACRIRNKDRPSLQIYQPGQGKRRMSTKKEDEKSAEDVSSKIGSKPPSPTLSEISVTFPSEKSTNGSSNKKPAEKFIKEKSVTVDRSKSHTSNEKSRVDKTHESNKSQSNKQGQSSGRNQQSQEVESLPVERKVSRYSERRNINKRKTKYEATKCGLKLNK